ncbi:hypothetical protein MMC09_003137 [Bachmanniomyces sp. S44760]|nr:hypothetical protein [Bachmanniomyces sp. S44760]
MLYKSISDKDQIYTGRTASESRRNQALPSPEPKVSSPPLVGAYKASHVEEKTQIPDIMPMRRGRPTKGKSEHSAPKPSPSPARGNSSDPFAALDSASNTAPSLLADSASFDQASSRFPPLDEFSLLHDSGTKFAFEAASNAENGQPSLHRELSKRVTEALADDAFAPRIEGKKSSAQPQTIPPTADHSTPSLSRPSGQSSMKITKPQTIQQPAPQRSAMVSTGTMTSPSPPQSSHGLSSQSARPIFRFPPSPEPRSASLSRNADTSPVTRPNPSARDPSNNPRPGLLDHRSKSQLGLGSLTGSNSSASSRPSLEGQRPSMLDLDNTVNRSKSTNSRVRPSSALVETTTKLLRRRESSRSRAMTDLPKPASDAADSLVAAKTGDSDGCEEPSKISSNVEFLRAMEEEDPGKRKEKRSSSGSKHIKRSSMPSISLSGTKNLLAGRFGEAFRRFETNNGPNNRESSPSPNDRESSELTPIAGSEATDGRSDDGQVVEETEPIPAEVRRELERRRLSQEEKRVTDGAAAYKQRVAKGADNDREGSRGRESNRAASIQSKVQSLLDENGKSSPTKTAEGCGRFTNHPHRNQEQFTTPLQYTNAQPVPQEAAYTSVDVKRAGPSHFSKTSSKPDMPGPSARSAFVAPISAPQSSTTDRPYSPRPTAPPKPQALRTGMTGSKVTGDPLGQTKSLGGGSRTAPSSSTIPSTSTFQNHHSNVINADDWEEKFSQRYPKLSGLELVETEIDKRTGEV